jgi:hypothetical protein
MPAISGDGNGAEVPVIGSTHYHTLIAQIDCFHSLAFADNDGPAGRSKGSARPEV